jgi:hypothetical protein
MRKFNPNSGRKSKHSLELRATPGNWAEETKSQQQRCSSMPISSTQRPAQYFILKGDVIQVIDPNVKQDLREIGKKLTNLRGSL